MRRLLHLLILAAVLWSGLHPAEPALAHEGSVNHQLEAGLAADENASGEGAQEAAHAGHHHCPVGTCHGEGPGLNQSLAARPLLFARPQAILGSLAQAPPLQPPAA